MEPLLYSSLIVAIVGIILFVFDAIIEGICGWVGTRGEKIYASIAGGMGALGIIGILVGIILVAWTEIGG